MLLSYESMRQNWPDGLEWKTKIFRTYVRLRPGVDSERFTARLNQTLDAKYPGRAEFEDRYLLLPITRIRHHNPGGGGSIKYVAMFCLIAIFILGIAGVNFTNLSTARSTQRAREVGLRKVLGSRRPQLARQFFGESLDMKITQGRDFSREFPTDVKTAFIANQEAARRMGLDSPVGTRIRAAGADGTLIGVVEDAHFRSRAHLIYPEIYRLLPSTTSGELYLFGVVMIRLRAGETRKGLGIIENMWRRVNRDYPFEYHFLDEAIDDIYTRESKIKTLVDYFSLLAVFISCMGLFGLASFITETRTKEIGVRKVLGASSGGIVRLVTREFALWVAVAADALIIALLTVIQQALRAARADPVEALRYE